VVWSYTGLSAEQMANRIVYPSERGMTTTVVNDIEHIESQSLNGVGVIKIFFHPHVNIGQAVAAVSARRTQVQLRFPARRARSPHSSSSTTPPPYRF
jgi:multidrug efflux pump subunit AcrB